LNAIHGPNAINNNDNIWSGDRAQFEYDPVIDNMPPAVGLRVENRLNGAKSNHNVKSSIEPLVSERSVSFANPIACNRPRVQAPKPDNESINGAAQSEVDPLFAI
jgi:hypothetical protein